MEEQLLQGLTLLHFTLRRWQASQARLAEVEIGTEAIEPANLVTYQLVL